MARAQCARLDLAQRQKSSASCGRRSCYFAPGLATAAASATAAAGDNQFRRASRHGPHAIRAARAQRGGCRGNPKQEDYPARIASAAARHRHCLWRGVQDACNVGEARRVDRRAAADAAAVAILHAGGPPAGAGMGAALAEADALAAAVIALNIAAAYKTSAA